MSVTVERPLGRDQGRDLDIYQIFGRIQGKSVARSRRGEKLEQHTHLCFCLKLGPINTFGCILPNVPNMYYKKAVLPIPTSRSK